MGLAPPTRRDVLTGLVALAVPGGRRPRARGQKVERWLAMRPDNDPVFFLLIVAGGPGSGEFIYDFNGDLRSANVGQAGPDPLQGITCQQGFSTFNGHGAVISLNATALDAFLFYADTGTSSQGALIASIASAAGVDPFGNHYAAGLDVTEGQITGSAIIIKGASGGEFTYDAGGNLRSANVGQVTTDPLQSITCQQGFSTFNGHGATISLNATALDAQLLYADTGTSSQGQLIGSTAANSGTDPFGNAFLGDGPAVYANDGTHFVATQLQTGLPSSVSGGIQVFSASSAAGPYSLVGGGLTVSSSGISFGRSALLLANISTDTTGYPNFADNAGLALNVSGSRLAQVGGTTVTGTGLTSLGSQTIPANDVESGSTYTIDDEGSFTTGSSVPSSATFSVYWGGTGGTLLASVAVPTIPASITNAGWFVEASVKWLSTTEALVKLKVGWHTASGIAGSAQYFTIGDVTGLTTTSSEQLTLAFQWGSAPGSQSLTSSATRFGRLA